VHRHVSRCGRVTWPARRQDPSHAFQARPIFIDKIIYYFISSSAYTFTDDLTSIAYFTFNSIVDLLHGSASLLARISQLSCFPQNIEHISSATSETFDTGLLDLLPIFLLKYLILYRHSTLCTMYCQRDKFNSSLRLSRITPGIEPTVAWAPTCQRLAGDVLSLLRL
jgi:hypothetical protein